MSFLRARSGISKALDFRGLKKLSTTKTANSWRCSQNASAILTLSNIDYFFLFVK